ncbi:MAG: hypothetical protein WAZ60_23835 [Desulfosalsimonadaceae bacterium]
MKASTHWNSMPFGECPICEKEWQIDDYYDLDNGSTVTCRHCGTEIELSDKDTTVTFTFTAEVKP